MYKSKYLKYLFKNKGGGVLDTPHTPEWLIFPIDGLNITTKNNQYYIESDTSEEKTISLDDIGIWEHNKIVLIIPIVELDSDIYEIQSKDSIPVTLSTWLIIGKTVVENNKLSYYSMYNFIEYFKEKNQYKEFDDTALDYMKPQDFLNFYTAKCIQYNIWNHNQNVASILYEVIKPRFYIFSQNYNNDYYRNNSNEFIDFVRGKLSNKNIYCFILTLQKECVRDAVDDVISYLMQAKDKQKNRLIFFRDNLENKLTYWN